MRIFIVVFFFLTTCVVCSTAQHERKIPFNGKLVDMLGSPIKKARVYVVSPRRYATTDNLGNFGLTDIDTSDTLKITVDKVTYKVAIDRRRSIVVRLDKQSGDVLCHEDIELFEKGFDHVNRRERGVGTIMSGAALRRTGSSNLLGALKGRVPGLNISTDGRPGSEGEANIRGIGSITQSTKPLFVVDGIVTESINHISIGDVEYVEILKEANLYGSRGANGAILIFLKRP